MKSAWTISSLRAACAIPLTIAVPWAAYAQKLVWTHGEAGALDRLNAQQTARAA